MDVVAACVPDSRGTRMSALPVLSAGDSEVEFNLAGCQLVGCQDCRLSVFTATLLAVLVRILGLNGLIQGLQRFGWFIRDGCLTIPTARLFLFHMSKPLLHQFCLHMCEKVLRNEVQISK